MQTVTRKNVTYLTMPKPMEAINTRIRAKLLLAHDNSSAEYSAARVNSPVLFKLSYSAK